jgi:DNA-binding MarR family transcriptional regulator
MMVQHPDDTALQLVIAVHRLIRSLRQAAVRSSLRPTQLLILTQLVDGESLRIGELAERVWCSQPTATTVVGSLSTAGLVERVPDSADGRAVRVRLTEEGRQSVVAVAREQAELLEQRLAALGMTDRDALHDTVTLLQKLTTG